MLYIAEKIKEKKMTIKMKVFYSTVLVLVLVPSILFAEEKLKRYSNPNYHIEMKYPSSWTYRDNIPGAMVGFASPREDAGDVFQENVIVLVQDMSSSPMSLENYTKLSENQAVKMFPLGKIVKSEPMTLSGLPGHKIIATHMQGQMVMKQMGAWTIIGSKAYLLTYSAEEEKFQKFLKDAESIFQSFEIKS